jgi:hypothetical protein
VPVHLQIVEQEAKCNFVLKFSKFQKSQDLLWNRRGKKGQVVDPKAHGPHTWGAQSWGAVGR